MADLNLIKGQNCRMPKRINSSSFHPATLGNSTTCLPVVCWRIFDANCFFHSRSSSKLLYLALARVNHSCRLEISEGLMQKKDVHSGHSGSLGLAHL